MDKNAIFIYPADVSGLPTLWHNFYKEKIYMRLSLITAVSRESEIGKFLK